ncbi:MAG: hypothetical protein ACXWH0_00595 [Acidimicrobiia bacterium]
MKTQLDLSLDLAFLASDQHRLVLEELREIKAMLRGLEQSPTG